MTGKQSMRSTRNKHTKQSQFQYVYTERKDSGRSYTQLSNDYSTQTKES